MTTSNSSTIIGGVKECSLTTLFLLLVWRGQEQPAVRTNNRD
jgi:hypothetical protein